MKKLWFVLCGFAVLALVRVDYAGASTKTISPAREAWIAKHIATNERVNRYALSQTLRMEQRNYLASLPSGTKIYAIPGIVVNDTAAFVESRAVLENKRYVVLRGTRILATFPLTAAVETRPVLDELFVRPGSPGLTSHELMFTQGEAASSAGEVAVTVLDATTHAPLSAAKVICAGPQIRLGYADTNGALAFEGLSPGRYTLTIWSPGFVEQKSTIVLSGDEGASIEVRLASLKAPKTIASVRAVVHPAVGVQSASSDSHIATIGGGLGADFKRLPDIDVGTRGVSIDALSAGATSTSVDGTPVVRGADNIALSDIGLDLFNSVTVSPIGTPGGPAVNLVTEDPTLAFRLDATLRGTQFSEDSDIMEARGTAGYVGYVFKSATRRDTTALDGIAFSDESGLRYDHTSAGWGDGRLLKVRLPFSETQSLTLEASALHTDNRIACSVASGGTPCSYGPGDHATQRAAQSSARYHGLLGPSVLDASFGLATSGEDIDNRERIVNAVHDPFRSTNDSLALTSSARLVSPIGRKNDIGFDVDANSQFDAFSGLNVPQQHFASHYLETNLFADVVSGSQIRTNATMGYTHANASHLFATLRNRIDFSSRDNISTRFSIGDASAPPIQSVPTLGSLSDAASVSYDCVHHKVFGAISGDPPNDPTDSGIGFDYTHEQSRLAVRLSGAHDVVSGAKISTLALADAIDGALNATELADINALNASNATCASTSPLTAADIYVAAERNARVVRNRLTLSAAASRAALTIAPYVAIASSTYRDSLGIHPVLYAPTVKAGALADFRFERGRSELIGFLAYEGSGNASALQPFALLNVGVSRRMLGGTLTVGGTNVSNTYAHQFASSAYAAPVSGGIIPIAQPLPRSTLRLTYSFNIGSSTLPTRIDALAALASLAQPSSDYFETQSSVLPATPPKDAYALDVQSPQCGPEMSPRAQAILTELHTAANDSPGAYVQSSESAKALETSIEAHPSSHGAAFTLTFNSILSFHAFSVCVPQHFTDVEDARARGLFVPVVLPDNSKDVEFFDSTVGEYVLIGSSRPTQPSTSEATAVTLEPEPARPPADPFVLKAACPASLTPYANAALAALAATFGTNAKRAGSRTANPFFVATEHHGKTPWYALTFSDPSAFSSLEQCAHIVAATKASRMRMGIGDSASSLNYVPAFGLYTDVP